MLKERRILMYPKKSPTIGTVQLLPICDIYSSRFPKVRKIKRHITHQIGVSDQRPLPPRIGDALLRLSECFGVAGRIALPEVPKFLY